MNRICHERCVIRKYQAPIGQNDISRKDIGCVQIHFMQSCFFVPFRLTTDHPEIGKLFPFGSKNLSYDQLKTDKDVKSHGKRVMETVGHAVIGLDNLDLLVPVLQDLAKRHVGYNVKRKQFAVSQFRLVTYNTML